MAIVVLPGQGWVGKELMIFTITVVSRRIRNILYMLFDCLVGLVFVFHRELTLRKICFQQQVWFGRSGLLGMVW